MEKQLCVFGDAAHIKLPNGHYDPPKPQAKKKGQNSLSNPHGKDIYFQNISSMIANLLSVNFKQFFVTQESLASLLSCPD